MGAFQKLLDATFSAERLAKRQAELADLQKAAAKRFELESAATNRFAGQDPEGGLRLYHGSPHNFDRFDFENNLLKGEGALAYGPGGYLTGHEPLAKDYAANLFGKHTTGRNKFLASPLVRQALTTNPKAAAEYLRATQVGKMIDHGIGDGSTRSTTKLTDKLPPFLERKFGGRPPTIPGGIHKRPYLPEGDPARYGFESTITASGIDDYRRLAESVGLPPEKQPSRIGRGGLHPTEMIRRGAELERAMKGRPDIRPRLQERLEPVDGQYADWRAFDTANSGPYDGKGFHLPGQGPTRRNLNSTWRFLNNRPGGTVFTSSMGSGARIDLRDPKWASQDAKSELARRLYEAPFEGSIEDMLAYDLPLQFAAPRTLGALSQLAEKHGFIDQLRPDMLGKDALAAAYKAIGGKPADKMRALKNAGLPGTYFLRGGQRSGGAPAERFVPDDYNYVIFDQTRLGPLKKTEFSSGGSVV